MTMTTTNERIVELQSFLNRFQAQLEERASALEEIHLEAAIDAKLTGLDEDGDGAIFNDYENSNAVSNCLSPFVPTNAGNILSFLSLTELGPYDVLLDIGCGDGRVCIAASKLVGCKSIGLDVSPPCIEMAKEVAETEGVSGLCSFYEEDATQVNLSGKNADGSLDLLG